MINNVRNFHFNQLDSLFRLKKMANNSRRRLSFVDLAHPQVWHKLLEYTEVTIALAKLS